MKTFKARYLKEIGKLIPCKWDTNTMSQKLKITSKSTPIFKKESFDEFIKSIGNHVPTQTEFLKWHNAQI